MPACRQCGKDNAEGMVFCGYCATPLARPAGNAVSPQPKPSGNPVSSPPIRGSSPQ
ncbi:MAG: zinc-ribbon domain-containing protein, partial [Candidatus Binatus sp.]